MATAKQVEANRVNAQRSTGPCTPEGKAVSAQNARKHGLTAQHVLLAGEDAEAFKELLNGLIAHCQPQGELKMQLVERMLCLLWNLRRVKDIEIGIHESDAADLSLERDCFGAKPTQRVKRAITFMRQADSVERLLRYDTSNDRMFYRALHELQRLQAARAGRDVAVPVAIDVTVTPSEVKVGE